MRAVAAGSKWPAGCMHGHGWRLTARGSAAWCSGSLTFPALAGLLSLPPMSQAYLATFCILLMFSSSPAPLWSSHAGQEDYCLDVPLHAPVVPEESRYQVLGTKIEIKMKKAVPGTQWPGLEAGAAAAVAAGSPVPAAPAPVAAAAAGEAGAAPAPAGPSLAYPYAG